MTYIKPQQSNTQKVFDAVYSDAGDYSLYTITGTGISSYSEEDFFVVKVTGTNVNGVSKINIDGIGEKFLYTPKGDNLNEEVLFEDNTYLVRYDVSLDAFTIMETGDVNVNNLNENFIDLKAYDVGSTTYALSSGTVTDTNGIIYDGERYLYISDGIDKKMFKFDTWTNTAVLEISGSVSFFHRLSYLNGQLFVPADNSANLFVYDDNLNLIKNITTTQGTIATHLEGNILRVLGLGDPAKVFKIDILTLTLIEEITGPIGTYKGGTIITNENYIIYSQNDGYGNNIGFINKNDYSDIFYINVGYTNTKALTLDDNGYLYVNTANGVVKINPNTQTILNTITGFNADIRNDIINNRMYVPSYSDNTVKVIDLENFSLIGTSLQTAINPQEVVAVGNAIYVANEGSGNLSYIGIDQLTAPDNGFYRIYTKSDGKLYIMDSTGAEVVVGTQT